MMLWMLWATAVTAVLGVCALLAERLSRAANHSGRWAWAGAIVGTVALQLRSLGEGSPSPSMAGADAAWLEAIRSSVASGVEAAARAAPTVAGGLDPWLVGTWAVASGLLGAGLVGGLRSLYVRATLWPRVRLLGHDVLLSDDFGPALLGVVRPTIVLPRSLLGLDRGALRIACRHELEHRRAADPLLFLASAALLVVTPWNVALWWPSSTATGACSVPECRKARTAPCSCGSAPRTRRALFRPCPHWPGRLQFSNGGSE
jgi:hypothetical protein